jgi:hypothetical protein
MIVRTGIILPEHRSPVSRRVIGRTRLAGPTLPPRGCRAPSRGSGRGPTRRLGPRTGRRGWAVHARPNHWPAAQRVRRGGARQTAEEATRPRTPAWVRRRIIRTEAIEPWPPAGALVRARSEAQPCAQRSAIIPVTCAGICRGKRRPPTQRPRPPKTEQPLRFTGGTGGRCSDPRLRASQKKSSPESRRPRERKRRRSEAKQARARPTHKGGSRADLVSHTPLAPAVAAVHSVVQDTARGEPRAHAQFLPVATPANGRRE